MFFFATGGTGITFFIDGVLRAARFITTFVGTFVKVTLTAGFFETDLDVIFTIID